MNFWDSITLAIFTLMLAFGQVLFKSVGLTLRGRSGVEALVFVIGEPTLYLALTLYGGATLLWIWIMSRVPLSQAYPWVAVGMVVVPLLGWLIFGERLAPTFWLGVALIVVGFILTQVSVTPVAPESRDAAGSPSRQAVDEPRHFDH